MSAEEVILEALYERTKQQTVVTQRGLIESLTDLESLEIADWKKYEILCGMISSSSSHTDKIISDYVISLIEASKKKAKQNEKSHPTQSS